MYIHISEKERKQLIFQKIINVDAITRTQWSIAMNIKINSLKTITMHLTKPFTIIIWSML